MSPKERLHAHLKRQTQEQQRRRPAAKTPAAASPEPERRPAPEVTNDTSKARGAVNDAIRAFMRTAAQRKCILCGGPAFIGGMFTPREQSRFGAPAGKVRTFWYVLCQGHATAEGREQVDALIMRVAPTDRRN